MKPSVLMTDPRHFQIKGGANPHTRLADNSLKTVDIKNVWPQWHAYVDALLDGGVDVYVVDAAPDLTGMVFAANAGFLQGRGEQKASSEKTFYPSHFMVAHRQAESPVFSAFMESFGFPVGEYSDTLRFEGEADGYPIGSGEGLQWVLTHGFRSDAAVGAWLENTLVKKPVLQLQLTDARYYHGDTLLCDLGGPLMAWPGGFDAASQTKLVETFGDRILELDDEEAETFVGNSFYVETEKGRLLYAPATILERTRTRIESLGVQVIAVDIGEFFGKGGGGPKCMVFNLGMIDSDEESLSEAQRAFRKSRHVLSLRKAGQFPGFF